jgi:hypothetical protein
MRRFVKDQFVWYYVYGMKEPKKYIFKKPYGDHKVYVIHADDTSKNPQRITLSTYGCYDSLDAAMDEMKIWEVERLERLDLEIESRTLERDRILRRRECSLNE